MQHLQKSGGRGDAMTSHWSYLHTGTLPRLISFVSHSCENTGGVGVFFPFWDAPRCERLNGRTLPFSVSFQVLAHSSALFCTFLHSQKIQLFSFQAIPHSLSKNTGVGYPISPD